MNTNRDASQHTKYSRAKTLATYNRDNVRLIPGTFSDITSSTYTHVVLGQTQCCPTNTTLTDTSLSGTTYTSYYVTFTTTGATTWTAPATCQSPITYWIVGGGGGGGAAHDGGAAGGGGGGTAITGTYSVVAGTAYSVIVGTGGRGGTGITGNIPPEIDGTDGSESSLDVSGGGPFATGGQGGLRSRAAPQSGMGGKAASGGLGVNIVTENFMVAGGEGTNKVAYTYDGIVWTASVSGSGLFTVKCNSVAWNGVIWVAGGEGTNQLAYSSDGTNWIASTSGNSVISGTCRTVAWNGSLWIAGGNKDSTSGGGVVAYSSDGITWTESTSGSVIFSAASVPSNFTTSIFAGSGSAGSADGSGTSASFNQPQDIVLDSTNGDMYLAESGNHRIRKITSAGVVTTFAGSGQGFADGNRLSAQFNIPQGLTIHNGFIYVADTGNHRIRKISLSTGIVSTVAGTGTEALTNGAGSIAQFALPWKLVVDSTGIIYVADRSNNAIRKIATDANSTVSTLAGNGSQGHADGTGTSARFNYPRAVRISPAGDIYVCDTDNHLIRKITPGGVVTTVAGNRTQFSIDGTGTGAAFGAPTALVFDSTGDLYVTEQNGGGILEGRLRRVTPTGVVTTVPAVSLTNPSGILIDSASNFFVAETNSNRVVKVVPSTFTVTGASGCFALGWNGSIWVAGGVGIATVAYSSDGITWTISSSGNTVFTERCNTVSWNGTLWVAGGSGTNRLGYSSNGILWTASSSGNGIFTTVCYAVAWNGSQWTAGGSANNRLCYSYDGINWTASTSGNGILTTECRTLAWNGVLWVAGGSGTNRLGYSYDGILWTASTAGNTVFTIGCYTAGNRRNFSTSAHQSGGGIGGSTVRAGGGGGGASGSGTDGTAGTPGTAGTGGAGISFTIPGYNGGTPQVYGAGGNGGVNRNNSIGASASANTGNGGGGGGAAFSNPPTSIRNGGNGGSGLVVIQYSA
jgi:hypothetical protein